MFAHFVYRISTALLLRNCTRLTMNRFRDNHSDNYCREQSSLSPANVDFAYLAYLHRYAMLKSLFRSHNIVNIPGIHSGWSSSNNNKKNKLKINTASFHTQGGRALVLLEDKPSCYYLLYVLKRSPVFWGNDGVSLHKQ